MWKANEEFKGITVKDNAVETIQTSDGHQITSASIQELAGTVASWLSTYKGGAYTYVSDVLASNNEADIAALVAKFDEAAWV